MTSDRSLDPFLRQLEDFSDQVFRGQPAPANELDPATRLCFTMNKLERLDASDADAFKGLQKGAHTNH